MVSKSHEACMSEWLLLMMRTLLGSDKNDDADWPNEVPWSRSAPLEELEHRLLMKGVLESWSVAHV